LEIKAEGGVTLGRRAGRADRQHHSRHDNGHVSKQAE